jgi:diguanylate cyclase (GGDEF)-like protein
MTVPATQTLMDTVVVITRKKNCDDFRACLIETLMSLLPTQEIAFLRCVRAPDGDTLTQDVGARRFASGAWRYVDTDGLRWRAVSTSATLALNEQRHIETRDPASGERIHCMPIIVDRRPPEIFYFRSKRDEGDEGDDTHMLLGFSQIYRNFLSLISDGERDALTGLLNRKTLETSLRRILETTARNRNVAADAARGERRSGAGDYWLGVIDIDHFKRINDGFGHLYGDEVLLLMSQIMQRSFRSEDLLFRYGGEEFVVVLAPASEDQARLIFERFRQNMAAHLFPQVGTVTVSTGVVRFGSHELPSTAVGHADQALYYAKDHGRNRVCFYEELVEAGKLVSPERESSVEMF